MQEMSGVRGTLALLLIAYAAISGSAFADTLAARASAPVVTVSKTGPGQAGYVHYFAVTTPDGERESQIGIELEDERIAWAFPDLGVIVSRFIGEGSVIVNGHARTRSSTCTAYARFRTRHPCASCNASCLRASGDGSRTRRLTASRTTPGAPLRELPRIHVARALPGPVAFAARAAG